MEYFERCRPPKKVLSKRQVMEEERKKFFNLVRKLHVYYRDQLSAALVSVSKFEKSCKYFIRALRVIYPVCHDDIPLLTLGNMEEELQIFREKSPKNGSVDEDVSNGVTPDVIGNRLETMNMMNVSSRDSSSRKEDEATSQHRAHCQIVETFLKNVQNFRLFRQHVKINIVARLQKLPNNIEETDRQKRSLGEVEALLGAWTILLDRNNNLVRLVHPEVRERTKNMFESEQEMAYYTGILSVLPKLTDIANKIEFALTKYEMSADNA